MRNTFEKSKRVSTIKGFLGYRTRHRDDFDDMDMLLNAQHDGKRATNSSKANSNK